MTGKLIVLSDLHLWGPEDPLYRALLRFLEFKLESGDKFLPLKLRDKKSEHGI